MSSAASTSDSAMLRVEVSGLCAHVTKSKSTVHPVQPPHPLTLGYFDVQELLD
jgi:hypothetical protein